MAALNNIQDSSRAYGRGRRRGTTANEDPAFRAALEIADPAARREAMAQYARQRAGAMFAPEGNMAPAPMPTQADVMSQVRGEPAPAAINPNPAGMPDGDEDDRMYADMMKYGSPGDVEAWQATPNVGYEDSPESTRARTNAGKQILAPRYQERIDEGNDRADDAVIESAPTPPARDGIDAIGDAAQAILARRRRR
jgi:hypothetical protein